MESSCVLDGLERIAPVQSLALKKYSKLKHLWTGAAGLLLVSLASGSAGCMQWFSGEMSTGISRLTVLNVGSITMLLEEDTRCGFSSPEVIDSITIDGEIGEYGTATYSVKNCVLEYNDPVVVMESCTGEQVRALGRVRVDAQKIVHGRLTGDPEQPAIPDSVDSAEILIEKAVFTNFHIKKDGQDNSLEIVSGSASGSVFPKLGRSLSDGACSVPTPVTAFKRLRYHNAEVKLYTPDRIIEAPVAESLLNALHGFDAEKENQLSGTLTLWGDQNDVPNDGRGLDPNYNRTVFAKEFECVEDLELPTTENCSIQPKLAHGAARLSVLTLSTIMQLIAEDENCGFMNDAVIAQTQTSGEIGHDGGSSLSQVEDCVLDFSEPTVIGTDCNGVQTTVQGRAVVSGSKTVAGIVTGDPQEPILPQTIRPAKLSVEAQLSEFSVRTSDRSDFLHVRSGRLGGEVIPTLAIDTELGVCALETPIAKLDNIQWQNGNAEINTEGMSFSIDISNAELAAVNGRIGNIENQLTGNITLDGEIFTIPDHDQALVPAEDYSYATLLTSFSCEPNLKVVQTDNDCDSTAMLAQGVGRLLLKNFGMLGSLIDENDGCGFSSLGNLVPDSFALGLFEETEVGWDISNCEINGMASAVPVPDAKSPGVDCIDTTKNMHGKINASARKTASGVLALANPPVQPSHREAAKIYIDDVAVDDYVIYEQRLAKSEGEPYLLIKNGNLSGIINPVTGEASSHPGSFHIKTPVAGFENVKYTGGEVTLNFENKLFNLVIDYAYLEGFNGSFEENTNWMSGEVSIGGIVYPLPIAGDDGRLDPDYEQSNFDASYECRDNLLETVPPGP